MWRSHLATPLRRAGLCVFGLAFVVAAETARSGTWERRSIGVALFLGTVAILIGCFRAGRRAFDDPGRTIRALLVSADPKHGAKALRALRLLEESATSSARGSPELVRLHWERVLSAASETAVREVAVERARRWTWLAWVCGGASVLAVGIDPFRIVEGWDVMLARQGEAPVPMLWLDSVRLSARPPSYLRRASRPVSSQSVALLPVGTVITFRGFAVHDRRDLFVTDGKQSVPLVSDGSGGMVAHWTVMSDAELRVSARFGDVMIPGAEPVAVVAIEDQAPNVELEGAPTRLRLAEVTELNLVWRATDDHGLRQVDLVMRSGGRQERRVLERLGGETQIESGGHVLFSRDAFLESAYLPVFITIEARDNDPIGGANWGASPAIVMSPPAVGEPEALRLKALRKARGQLLVLLNDLLRAPPLGSEPGAAEARARGIAESLVLTTTAIKKTLEAEYLGLSVSGMLQAYVEGQLDQLEGVTNDLYRQYLEDGVLALDTAVQSLGRRDAALVSGRLALIAEEAEGAAHRIRSAERVDAVLPSLDAALFALKEGGAQLRILGALGRDIGSVLTADLGRIRRSRDVSDFLHVELAARHLAERLKRAKASFGAKGQGGGVESGGGGGGEAGSGRSPSEGPATDSDQKFDKLAGALRKLAQSHQQAIERATSELARAMEAAVDSTLNQEAKKRAEAIRRAVEPLPLPGPQPGTAAGAAAQAREHGRAMAHALEKQKFAEAEESGLRALSMLDSAGKLGMPQAVVDLARQEIREQLVWARQAKARLEGAAEEQAKAGLGAIGDLESELAQLAAQLATEHNGTAPLSKDMKQRIGEAGKLMNEAVGAFAEGAGRLGIQRQRAAQRLLESADPKNKTKGDSQKSPKHGDTPGDSDLMGPGGDAPEQERKRLAEEFRRRVMKGLSREQSDQLSPAVKRYAEGLLR